MAQELRGLAVQVREPEFSHSTSVNHWVLPCTAWNSHTAWDKQRDSLDLAVLQYCQKLASSRFSERPTERHTASSDILVWPPHRHTHAPHTHIYNTHTCKPHIHIHMYTNHTYRHERYTPTPTCTAHTHTQEIKIVKMVFLFLLHLLNNCLVLFSWITTTLEKKSSILK